MTKKKKALKFLLVGLILLIGVGVAFAGTYRSPSGDTACQVGSSCFNNFGVYTSSGGVGVCNPSIVGYIKWDLSGDTLAQGSTIGSADLTLTVESVTGAPAGGMVTFDIYAATINNFNEGGSDPGRGLTSLATKTANISGGSGTKVVFSSSALGSHFQTGKTQNSGVVGIAVVMTGGCTASTTVVFGDVESGASTEPDLIFYTPSAVNLQEVSASTSSNPTIWMALALPLIVGLVLLFARRRAVK